MSVLLDIREKALQCSFSEAEYLDMSKLQFYPEVRRICEGNACRNYGASWACPPAVGTLEECRARVQRYQRMLLFSKKYELEDSFDFEGMTEGLYDFKATVDRFNQAAKEALPEYLLLSNEGCGRCAECTYPHTPCRFPEALFHSLEGYGFIVSELAAQAGMKYNNGPNTVTFFGTLLFNEEGTVQPAP